jgi:hypothetical protein
MTDRPTSAPASEPGPVAAPGSPTDSSPEIELAEVELDADPWGEGGGASPQWQPSVWQAPAVDEVGRHARQRQAMHVVTLLALGVAFIAVLVSAAPAFGRALGPGRSVAALRGIARAARAAGWARAPVAPPAASEATARPAERGGLPGFDPLAGTERGSALVDPFGDRREGARPSAPGAEGQRDDSGAALRLGVLREPASGERARGRGLTVGRMAARGRHDRTAQPRRLDRARERHRAVSERA